MTKHDLCTRERLIDAALNLIWTQSYNATGVEAICKAASVQKGSFYHYFPSKADLTIAALCQVEKTYEDLMSSAYAPGVRAIDRISLYADFVIRKQAEKSEMIGRVCGCPISCLGAEIATQDERIRTKVEEMMREGQNFMEKAINDAIHEGDLPPMDAHQKARDLFSYSLGVMLRAKIQNDLSIIQQELEPGLYAVLGVTRPAKTAA